MSNPEVDPSIVSENMQTEGRWRNIFKTNVKICYLKSTYKIQA